MGKYYFIVANDIEDSDYIYLDEASIPERLRLVCQKSEFQYVDKSLRELALDESSGSQLADFICSEQNNVPLVSERLKKEFDRLDIRNLFYQRVNLVRKFGNLYETYWLAIPPRIDCLRKDQCIVDELNHAETITIEEEKVGNYEIFKIAGLNNNEIIVTKKLKEVIEKAGILEGFHFFEDENLRSM